MSVVHPRNIATSAYQAAIPSFDNKNSKNALLMEPYQLMTQWMSAEAILGYLERGDLVEIRRGSYTVRIFFPKMTKYYNI